MQTNAQQIHGAILAKSRIKIYSHYKHDNVIGHRAKSRAHTSETSELFEVFPLIAFLPEKLSSTKAMVMLGGNSLLVSIADFLLLRYGVVKPCRVCKIGKISQNCPSRMWSCKCRAYCVRLETI